MCHSRAISHLQWRQSRGASWSQFCSPSSSEAKEDLPDVIYIRFRTVRFRRQSDNRFSGAAKNFGFTISLKKTRVLYQPPRRKASSPPHISIDGTNLNTSLTLIASSAVMPQSARILTIACPKPIVSLEDCQKGYDRVIRSASPPRPRYTGPSSFTPSCTVLRRGFFIGSRSGYLTIFTNAACAPSLALNGKTTCQTCKSSREPACPPWSPSCFRCSCDGLATSKGWKTFACPKLQRAPRRKAQSWCSKKALQ